MRYVFLVVGAGLFGATFAQLAKAAGKSVLVIEKRPHIAGNCYTEEIEDIHVHQYGAHIFHTNDDEVWNYANFQGNAVVNYTDKEIPWIRIIEHKWFYGGKSESGKELTKTVISYEYSNDWKLGNEPYYPISDQKNNILYEQYRTLAKKENKVCFCGRLGEYAYKDMDDTIKSAIQLFSMEQQQLSTWDEI